MRILIYFAVIAISSLIQFSNSKISTMWKLNAKTGRIETLGKSHSSEKELFNYNLESLLDVYSQDNSFYVIVASTVYNDRDGLQWQSPEFSLQSLISQTLKKNMDTIQAEDKVLKQNIETAQPDNVQKNETLEDDAITLDCGQPVNYTHYDYIINLGSIKCGGESSVCLLPEPDVINFFLNNEKDASTFKLAALEKHLKRLKRNYASSCELFHQIGNYWRIVGDSVEAVKCFRRALDLSPTSSDVMYDLAIVLYKLQYLDDAINMARRSIEYISPAYTAWRQYFLLGDILKTYGDLRGSIHYYRLALELNPNDEQLLKAISEAESKPSVTLHVYTIVIILTLVATVLIVIVTSSNINAIKDDQHNSTNGIYSGNDCLPHKHHFNRAMAMRSLKGGVSRIPRQRKY